MSYLLIYFNIVITVDLCLDLFIAALLSQLGPICDRGQIFQ